MPFDQKTNSMKAVKAGREQLILTMSAAEVAHRILATNVAML